MQYFWSGYERVLLAHELLYVFYYFLKFFQDFSTVGWKAPHSKGRSPNTLSSRTRKPHEDLARFRGPPRIEFLESLFHS